MEPFKVPIIKAEHEKKVFLEGISQLSIMVWPTINSPKLLQNNTLRGAGLYNTLLKERFDQPCFKASGNLESLLLESLSNQRLANETERAECKNVRNFWISDVKIYVSKWKFFMFTAYTKSPHWRLCFNSQRYQYH